jgi:defect-in-organelle-trafficking protein DotC
MKLFAFALLSALSLTSFMSRSVETSDTTFQLSNGKDPQAEKAMQDIIDKSTAMGSKESSATPSIRLIEITKQAQIWGMEEGMYFYHTRFQSELESYAADLTKIVDFNQFIIDGNLLLPTVEKTTQLFEKNSSTDVRKVAVAYKLADKAEAVFTAPTWRDYLMFPLSKPEPMPTVLMPRTAEEEEAFTSSFKKGWREGKEQAELILDESFSRLQRKLDGLFEFRYANITNVVSMPRFKLKQNGVVLDDSGKIMYVNDQRLIIDHDSYFKDIEEWTPVFVDVGD